MAFLSFDSNPSALFAIEDDVIPVESLGLSHEGRGQIVREARSGRLRTAVTAENPYRRVWSGRTSILDIADVEDLEATLRTAGSLTLEGVRVGTAREGLVRTFSREEDNGVEARVSFEIAEQETFS